MTEWERQQEKKGPRYADKFGISIKDSHVNSTNHKAGWSGMAVDRLDEVEVQPFDVRIVFAKHSTNPVMKACAKESLRGGSLDSGT